VTRDPENEWAEFLDRLVHDLREPLRSIHTFSELLAEVARDRLGSDGDQFVNEILGSASRVRTLVDGLAKYSLSLRKSSDPAVASLQLAFNIAVMSLEEQIKSSNATITGSGLPKVGVSLERLIQLFENLLGNSLRFRGSAPPLVSVSAEPDEAAAGWLIRVEDNGMGIAPADLERIFKPFARTVGKELPGLGLGLSICRKIVEGHGGTIWMESQPGRGSICSFTLPAAE
jgi:two-component system, chemotaxis family, sensor kinase Cph1